MKKTLLSLTLLLYAVSAFAQKTTKDEIDAFTAKTGAVATIDNATNSLSFLRFPLTRPYFLPAATTPLKALSFIKQNPGLIPMTIGRDTYTIKETKKDNYGLEHVVLQQFYQGVPVYDGTLRFHFNKNNDLAAMNGNLIQISKLNAAPSVSKEEAAKIAVKLVTGQKRGSFKAPLKANKTTLYVFQKGLAQGYPGQKHLVYEVEVRNDKDVREFLFIDAHTKALVEQFAGMHSIKRELYEVSISPETKKWQEGDPLPGALDQWQQAEVRTSGQIYNMMKHAFGYVSYDDHDATMITVNNDENIFCPNAVWNGVSAGFCNGTAVDDVIAHEWAHAYTEYTSGLIYAWQSGAMNEAYSDIWGETVDQINGYLDTGENNDIRTTADCAGSDRWLLGEKTTEFGGALRDMWNPNCKGNPGKVTDSQYECTGFDQGGVHTNSGVLNHAYALLVDGGTYNGQTIKGIGLVKAAHIFWHAQAAYMTSTTDFAAQADILQASLADLIGINLTKLTASGTPPTGLSGKIITEADAAELEKVLAAVELRKDTKCGRLPLLTPVAAICSGGSPENAFFYENFESGLDDWTVSNSGVAGTWTDHNWVASNTAPGGRTGTAAFGIAPATGNCSDNIQAGVISIASPVITIPSGSTGVVNMAFDHYFATEYGYDGGNIKYRINSGEWKLVPAKAFIANAYNAVLATASQLSINPLQGQPGFTGTNPGSLTGSWGQSRINITLLGAKAGSSIQFRWDLGTDACGGIGGLAYASDGWYIDDVRVYSCAEPTVQFVHSASVVNEAEAITPGDAPNECLQYVEKFITVRINKAPSAPVTVTLNTEGGTAKQGNMADYSITPSSFILRAGKLSQEIAVRIYNDSYLEGEETVKLSYTLVGGNAYPETYNQEHTIRIKDDEKKPGTEYSVLLFEDFNNGFPSDSGWSVHNGGAGEHTWEVVQSDLLALDKKGRPFLFMDSDAAILEELDEIAESAPFNTVGMSTIKLTFMDHFLVYPFGVNEMADVDVWDGSEWHTVLRQDQSTGTSGSFGAPSYKTVSIPVAFANPAMKIRFRYRGNWDYWWAIDNVKVTGGYVTEVENAVTAASEGEYLGPKATAIFYDPDTKNLIAKIKNLSDHDYGCTSVVIDRAGQDETDWIDGYHITKKTFKVTPSNPDPAGKYEITLYYKNSELPNFNGSDIKSMGKSEGGIGLDNEAETSMAAAVVSEGLNADYAFTATFNSGFSGFGLSDLPVLGAAARVLPASAVRFEGKNTAEGNLLSWSASPKANNNYFDVERSTNGQNFIQTGRITAQVNKAVENQYTFTDSNYPKGISYYRLKQVGKDGASAYSPVVSIDALYANDLKFFPNPVQSLLTMELPDPAMKTADVRIINASGQEVMTKQNVKSRNGSFNLELGNLPSGRYEVILLGTPVKGVRLPGEKKRYVISVLKL